MEIVLLYYGCDQTVLGCTFCNPWVKFWAETEMCEKV